MKAEWGMARIKRGGQIKEQMVPGVIVGGGLTVTQFPNTDEMGQSGYGLTMTAFGVCLPEVAYFSWRLAVRCAEELLRVASFEGSNEAEVAGRIQGVWDTLLKPICARYLYLDELWEIRRASKSAGQDGNVPETIMMWDAWARRN